MTRTELLIEVSRLIYLADEAKEPDLGHDLFETLDHYRRRWKLTDAAVDFEKQGGK